MLSKTCNNCNAELYGEYCSKCGQKNKELNLSIITLIQEYFINLFSLDSKIFITLKHLITKPGFLSNEYIKGRQKKYVLPGKLYLFLSVLTILVISLIRENNGSSYMKYSHDRLGILISDDINGINITRWGGYGGNFSWDLIDTPIIEIDKSSLYSKAFLLCFPIYALLLKLFYRKKLYIHNMILSLHNHIFILLILLISIPIRLLTGYNLFGDPTWIETRFLEKIIIYVTFFSLSLYIYLSALNYYNESKLLTLIKYIPLMMGWFFVMAYSFVFMGYLFTILPNVFY